MEFIIYTHLKKYLNKYNKLFVCAFFLAIASAITEATLAYFVKPLLDDLFINKKRELLYILPLFFIALYVLKSSIRFSLSYTLRYIATRVVQKIRDDLLKKIIYLPVQYFSVNTTGGIMSRVLNDVTLIQTAIPIVVSIVRDVLSVLLLIGVIFKMNAKLAVMALLIYPFFIYPFTVLGKRIRRYSRRGQEQVEVISSILQEDISGIRIVKAFGQEEKEIARFDDANNTATTFTLKAGIAADFLSPLMESVSSVGIAGIVFYGGLQSINGEITPGDFFSFLTAVTLVYEPIKRLGNANATIQQGRAGLERVIEVFSIKNHVLENDGEIICSAKGKDITFDNVIFSYEANDKIVLDNVSFTIKAGSTAAFVGHSGAGKSTIANLVPRFYDVDNGSIKIGGVDVRDFQLHSLRSNIGYVTQEPFLFDDTIYNNIAYSDGNYSKDDIINAAKAAYAHDFIMQLPNGYDTIAGERGVRLSGGQKQRITIARALLKNPPILILDEATSALDVESEREVQKALENLMKGRTSLVIAHRLSTVINSDIIIVMDSGNIVDIGKHQELLKISETYKKLYTSQIDTAV